MKGHCLKKNNVMVETNKDYSCFVKCSKLKYSSIAPFQSLGEASRRSITIISRISSNSLLPVFEVVLTKCSTKLTSELLGILLKSVVPTIKTKTN